MNLYRIYTEVTKSTEFIDVIDAKDEVEARKKAEELVRKELKYVPDSEFDIEISAVHTNRLDTLKNP